MELKNIQKEAQKAIENSNNLEELSKVYSKYCGKKAEVSLILKSLKKLSKERRIEVGKQANEAKNLLKFEFNKRMKELSNEAVSKEESIDITAPGKKIFLGHLHPLTLVRREVEDIFQRLGFSIIEGPQIENEKYNFDALNIPKDHPARDLWDTLWLKTKEPLLLRTHTSPVQIRYMEKNQPPIRIIVPGKVFRHEATDSSHDIQFYQVEGLMVDKNVSSANFKAVIQEFFNQFFKKEVKIRLRPSYFPFTEPSFEIDMACLVCNGKGCSACSKTGWMEMMGAGMVHPNVFKNSGLNHKNWQGFAFGMGLDRLTMMKYRIDDIRLLYSGDLRFINQF